MPRCVICDYCDTVEEISLFRLGLIIHGQSRTFTTDPLTGDEICSSCVVDPFDLYGDEI